jgi:hypothetical protein
VFVDVPLTADDVSELMGSLPGVVVATASEESGAPPVGWSDTFCFFDPHDLDQDQRFPFATIVTHDYPGFDTASDLARDEVFRVNIAVGRESRLGLGRETIPDKDNQPCGEQGTFPRSPGHEAS